jgi:hypothetical protein
MTEGNNKQKKFRKIIKIICISLGGGYALIGLWGLLFMTLQSLMDANFIQTQEPQFIKYKEVLNGIWTVHLPLMILIGFGYLIFGLQFKRIKSNKFMINIVLSIISLIWTISYTGNCIFHWDILFDGMAHDPEIFYYLAYVYAIFGFVAVFALFTVPQYIIGKLIKKLDNEIMIIE